MKREDVQLFKLIRIEDESGVSGTGHVADGIIFHDGTCALHWRTPHTSTTVYKDFATVLAIHGHGGKTRSDLYEHPYDRGVSEAIQDRCENCPFASIGGLNARAAPKVPAYIPAEHTRAWLSGYLDAARDIYGDDWQTCSFGWRPAMTLPAEPAVTVAVCGKPCAHAWDGPMVSTGTTDSATCSRCGVSAMDHTLMFDAEVSR